MRSVHRSAACVSRRSGLERPPAAGGDQLRPGLGGGGKRPAEGRNAANPRHSAGFLHGGLLSGYGAGAVASGLVPQRYAPDCDGSLHFISGGHGSADVCASGAGQWTGFIILPYRDSDTAETPQRLSGCCGMCDFRRGIGYYLLPDAPVPEAPGNGSLFRGILDGPADCRCHSGAVAHGAAGGQVRPRFRHEMPVPAGGGGLCRADAEGGADGSLPDCSGAGRIFPVPCCHGLGMRGSFPG